MVVALGTPELPLHRDVACEIHQGAHLMVSTLFHRHMKKSYQRNTYICIHVCAKLLQLCPTL